MQAIVKLLLNALLAITADASKAGVELPNGFTKVIFDLGQAVLADELSHDTLAQIIKDAEAVLLRDLLPAQQTALAPSIEKAKSVIDKAKVAVDKAVAAEPVAEDIAKAVDSVTGNKNIENIVKTAEADLAKL